MFIFAQTYVLRIKYRQAQSPSNKALWGAFLWIRILNLDWFGPVGQFRAIKFLEFHVLFSSILAKIMFSIHTVKLQVLTRLDLKHIQIVYVGDIGCLCTVTFCQKHYFWINVWSIKNLTITVNTLIEIIWSD